MLRRLWHILTRFVIPLGWTALLFWLLKLSGAPSNPIAVVVGAVSFALGFALQTVLSNFLEGKWVQIEHDFDEGDWIAIEGTLISGQVQRLGVRTVRIKKATGDITLIPYSTIFASSVSILSPASVDLLLKPAA